MFWNFFKQKNGHIMLSIAWNVLIVPFVEFSLAWIAWIYAKLKIFFSNGNPT